jgi:alpha-glucosidase
MHRYVQTWSGDNSTSWETLKYNLKMGLGLALSGVSNTGHDIGGFSGPAPDPELFVRWVQFGVFMPRFSIHSWNDDGTTNAPWMYPEVTPVVRHLIKLRYRLIPYLYHLLWRYHRDYEPIVRPTFFDFPDDPRCWQESDEMLLGRSLLAAPVVEPGSVSRDVYLPSGAHWYDFWSGEVFDGGRTISRAAPWSQPVMLARESCVIPINLAAQTFVSRMDHRGFMVFPPPGSGAFTCECFEDDGESNVHEDGGYGGWRITVDADPGAVSVRLERFGAFVSLETAPSLILPASEKRRVSLSRS